MLLAWWNQSYGLQKYCIKFIKWFLSLEIIVCTIRNMSRYSSYSIMGSNMNFKLFNDKYMYCLNERNVYMTWKCMHENNKYLLCIFIVVNSFSWTSLWDILTISIMCHEADMRDKYRDGILNKLLNIFAQSNIFTTEHAICIYYIFLILF